jgi:hypothetical protein
VRAEKGGSCSSSLYIQVILTTLPTDHATCQFNRKKGKDKSIDFR